MDVDERKIAVGFVGALVVLALLVYIVGIGDIVDALVLIDVQSAVLLCALGLCWLIAWGISLHAVLKSLDIEVSIVTAVLLYASAAFANNITPFGHAGGEPFSGYLISSETDAAYERSLAAIASVDSINFVPSITFAILGLAYYALQYTLIDQIRYAIGYGLLLAVVISILLYLGWRFRTRVRSSIVAALDVVLGVVDKLVPHFSVPDREEIRVQVNSFFQSIGRVATDRRRILSATTFSTLGWFVLCLALWISIRGIGLTAPLSIAFIIIPVAGLANITPLPGGTGGVEFVIIAMLVPITNISPASAAAIAIVYRAATYLFPTVLGGLSVLFLQGRTTV